MEDVLKDKRFAHIAQDPRFRQMKQKDRKVKIDRRFQSMFNDKRFKLKYTVDSRGRPLHATTNENLKKYYDLSDSEESSSEEEEEEEQEKTSISKSQQLLKKEKKNKTETQATKKKLKNKSEKEKSKTKSDKTIKKSKAKVKSELNDVDSSSDEEEIDTGKGKTEKETGQATAKSRTEKISKVSDSSKKTKRKTDLEESVIQDGDTSKEDTEERLGLASDGDSDADTSGIEEESEEDTRSDKKGREEAEPQTQDTSDPEESDEEDSEDEGFDKARGLGNIESSDDDDSDSSSESEEDEFEHKWAELDTEAVRTETVTRSLAVCNMDWDRIRAEDIMVLMNSFKPTGGTIHSVTIYPSEYGLERMKEEKVSGPAELREKRKRPYHSHRPEDEEQEGKEFQREKLREYQLNRLKYYYAVVECDSAGTAGHIYEECDGREYESSSNVLDLRFIPDDMTFDTEPKSVAMDVPDSSVYQPSLYGNTALSQTKVELTWDETDRNRLAVTTRKFKEDELENIDFSAYLASSSEEDEGQDEPGDISEGTSETVAKEKVDEESQIKKYRDLIQSIKDAEATKEDEDMDMEVTWEPGLKESAEKLQKEQEKKKHMSVWDEYLEKRKEKKRQRKKEKKSKQPEKEAKEEDEEEDEEEVEDDIPSDIDLNDPYFKEEMDKLDKMREPGTKIDSKKKGKKKKGKGQSVDAGQENEEAELALLMMDEDDNKKHFSLKGIQEQEQEKGKKKKKRFKKKKKNDEEEQVDDTFQLDVGDSRFAGIYNNPAYNIDPSASEYKATKSMEKLIQEKLKRRTGTLGNRRPDKPPLDKSREPDKPFSNKSRDQEKTLGGSREPDKTADVGESAAKKPKLGEGEQRVHKDASLAMLVKSVKAKTKSIQERKNKRK